MNAKITMPGFTAENALGKTVAPYRAASVFDSQTSRAYVQPAMMGACKNVWDAFMNAPAGSPEETVFIHAFFAAGCR